jgi:hypothetical protein
MQVNQKWHFLFLNPWCVKNNKETVDSRQSVIVVLYNDVEKYPPTINKAIELSRRVDQVTILGRSLKKPLFTFPKNVKYVRHDAYFTDANLDEIPAWRKLYSFIGFIQRLKKEIKLSNPSMVICHDMMAAFAYWLLLKIQWNKNKPLFWYHNHDVIHDWTIPRQSVMWLAKRYEPGFFNKMDIFTLPVEERKIYFPIQKFTGLVHVLPNYPLLSRINQIRSTNKGGNEDTIRLLYQGSLGRGHGFENFIEILNEEIHGKHLSLTLLGKISEKYREELSKKAIKEEVVERFKIVDPIPYVDLYKFSSTFHIGLATHIPGKKAIYKYGATSSNKIYEYPAAGLPVILYDDPHYKKYLEKYSWISFTDLTSASILKSIETLHIDYEEKCRDAYNTILGELNYEKVFDEVWNKVAEMHN